ncbi:hypothetical protein AB0M95_39430 [Sphaerisporangium sp. NPDC051017]|uniref:hypothetical protein n=1 Tax=Sphaerisporangium sp. NPDC051017 TaxID=3154636 RepID=UPI0034447D6F
MATKTSFATFLLYSIFNSGVLEAESANTKGLSRGRVDERAHPDLPVRAGDGHAGQSPAGRLAGWPSCGAGTNSTLPSSTCS